jgi:hypothetical protein
MRTPTCADCAYCLDGMLPGVEGLHPQLGLVYQRCPFCMATGAIPLCTECGDNAVFPADFTCLHCLLEALAARGLTAAICPSCTGVIYVTTLPTQAGDAL